MADGKDVILLISSNASFAHSLEKILSDNGYLITIASNDFMGIAHARTSSLPWFEQIAYCRGGGHGQDRSDSIGR